jgi:hypothetical protein
MTEKFECSFCGENIKKEDAIEIANYDEDVCCPDCLYDHLCDECDEIILYDDLIFNDKHNCYLCENCYEEIENKTDEESISDE